MGSNGSVIPIFKQQITEGGPVTITDKNIIRYFMTIPEAAQLVLQAGFYADKGEIFVLDMGEPVKILDLAEKMIRLSGFKPYKDIDIIEIGTPFVIEYGMEAVRVMKKEFPEKEILADLKIMDAGDYEAEEALKAGADYVTVLGVTDILTVKGCIDAANRYGKQVVVDMICVEDMPKKIAQMEEIQAHIIAVHVGADQQAAGREPLEDLKLMKECVKAAGVSVAGGINGKNNF